MPSDFQVTNITSTSAVLSWIPSNSNWEHILLINGRNRTIIKPGGYRCVISGNYSLSDDSCCHHHHPHDLSHPGSVTVKSEAHLICAWKLVFSVKEHFDFLNSLLCWFQIEITGKVVCQTSQISTGFFLHIRTLTTSVCESYLMFPQLIHFSSRAMEEVFYLILLMNFCSVTVIMLVQSMVATMQNRCASQKPWSESEKTSKQEVSPGRDEFLVRTWMPEILLQNIWQKRVPKCKTSNRKCGSIKSSTFR